MNFFINFYNSSFFSNLLSTGTQVLILFIMMSAGFILKKINFLSKTGINEITDILFYAVTPCVIANSFINTPFSKESFTELGIFALITCVYFIVFCTASFLLFPKTEPEKRGILRYGVIFSNCGYFAIPLGEAILGDKGVFLVSVYMAVFNIVCWTFGVNLFSGKPSVKKVFLNPGTVGIFFGLIFYFIPVFSPGFILPKIIKQPVAGFSALNTPVAMIIIGYYLAKTKIKINKQDLNMIISILTRLIIIPVIAFFALKAVGIKGELLLAAMIPICAPPAMNSVMFASKFNKDAVFTSKLACIGTILSIITMPVILAFCRI